MELKKNQQGTCPSALTSIERWLDEQIQHQKWCRENKISDTVVHLSAVCEHLKTLIAVLNTGNDSSKLVAELKLLREAFINTGDLYRWWPYKKFSAAKKQLATACKQVKTLIGSSC